MMGGLHAQQPLEFTVMTYNILGDSNITYGNYHLLPHEVINWDIRKYKIIDKIIRQKPDVIFLQEVNPDACNFFSKTLQESGYYGQCEYDLATFYKNASFDLKYKKDFKFSVGKGALELWVQSQSKETFRLINVHLKWDNKPPDIHKGCRQIQELSYFLRGYNVRHESNLTILAGDFNFNAKHKCMDSISSIFIDSQQGAPYSTYYGDQVDRIDYIFHSKGWQAINRSLSQQPLLLGNKLPTEDEPSDHIPVMTTLIKIK